MKQFKAHPVHGTVEELWTAFHKNVKRIMLANTERQGEFLQEKLVQWLHEKQQPTAALWFEKFWTGRRGRWTMAHAGHANVHTNSSLEGRIGQCKDNWPLNMLAKNRPLSAILPRMTTTMLRLRLFWPRFASFLTPFALLPLIMKHTFYSSLVFGCLRTRR